MPQQRGPGKIVTQSESAGKPTLPERREKRKGAEPEPRKRSEPGRAHAAGYRET